MIDLLETLAVWVYLVVLLVVLLFWLKENENLNMAAIFLLFVIISNLVLPLPKNNSPITKTKVLTQKPIVSEKVLGNAALELSRGGGEGGLNLESYQFSEKTQKFEFLVTGKLWTVFPDWTNRMNYEEEQKKVYKKAMQKQKEIHKLFPIPMKNSSKFYTTQELNAINYFNGQGFYAKHQDPSMPPNIYDTRTSFLIKMQDPMMRKNFLKNFRGVLVFVIEN